MKSTKYRTDAEVLAMVLEDMQAAGLIGLKPDKEISLAPHKEMGLAPEVQVSETAAMSRTEPARPLTEKELEGSEELIKLLLRRAGSKTS